jgi:hypothetical protein
LNESKLKQTNELKKSNDGEITEKNISNHPNTFLRRRWSPSSAHAKSLWLFAQRLERVKPNSLNIIDR